MSYLADFEGDEETVTFKGVLGYSFKGELKREGKSKDFHPFTLTPYVGADLIERDDPTKDGVRNIFAEFDANVLFTEGVFFRGGQ